MDPVSREGRRIFHKTGAAGVGWTRAVTRPGPPDTAPPATQGRPRRNRPLHLPWPGDLPQPPGREAYVHHLASHPPHARWALRGDGGGGGLITLSGTTRSPYQPSLTASLCGTWRPSSGLPHLAGSLP